MGRFREWPPEILEKVRSLPDAPGVYRMRDKRGRILYIGKALSLRDRVSSYFNKSPKHGPNIEYMLGRLEDFDVMLTRTENEAFILEASLIKQFQPKYNILLKDDKEYPYIKITTNEPYPRLLVTRSVADDGSRYFGPYTSVNAMRMALRFISNLFNLRTCSLDLDGKKFIPKPCLDYHLKLCSGPCADLINRDDYGGLVRQAIKFFSGSESEVQSEIERMMYEASEARRYEAAARFRDVLYAVKRTRDRHRLWGRPDDFFDALGYAYSEKTAVVMVLPVRGGRVLGELEFKMENELEEEPGVILASFIQQYYSNREHIQPEILLPLEIPAAPAAAEWLTSLLGRSVHLKVPRRGPRADLVRMVMENAAERLKSRLLRAPGEFVITPGVSRVKELLSLPFYPRRIEGYDISHHRGKETVGSMVVFTDGSPDNRAYRSFTIRGKTAGDDLKALSEVLRRRLLRFLSDDKWHFPDTLLLIDGGRTQLDAALAVVRELKLEYPAGLRHDGASFENGDGGAPAGPDETKAADSEDLDSADTDDASDAPADDAAYRGRADAKSLLLPAESVKIEDHPLDSLAFVALAKREETLLQYDGKGNLLEFRLDKTDPGLSLLIQIRDEAHRRAQLHRSGRVERQQRRSALEDVAGVGPGIAKTLLKTYKSLKKIREAEPEELAKLPGMNEKLAAAVKKYLVERENYVARKFRLKDEIVELRRKPRLVKVKKP